MPGTNYDAIIVGAGIGGLALSYRLARAGRQVLLVERNDRIGGVVHTEKRGEFLLEKGPNSFSNGAEMMALIEEAGLGDRALKQPIREHDRFVWKEGRLRKVPLGPFSLLTSDVIKLSEKTRLIRGLWRPYDPPESDIALGTFFREVLGDAVVDSLLKPFLAGVYAADADRVSFEATFPQLFDAVRENRRLIDALKGMRSQSGGAKKKKKSPRCLVSFPEGLAELPECLAKSLKDAGGEIRTGVSISLSKEEGNDWTVLLGDGEAVRASEVILTSRAKDSAEILAPHSREASDFLRELEYARLTILHAGVEAASLPAWRNGFGFLSVDNQGVDTLGMIWSSNIFPGRAPDGHHLLTCFYGGEKDPAANDLDDEALRTAFRQDLNKIFGFQGGDFPLLEITRWEQALPVFRIGHAERLRQMEKSLLPGLRLLANFRGHISMPDRVKQAERVASEILRHAPQETATHE